jgi:predicted DNA-binding mobile mystery protein A
MTRARIRTRLDERLSAIGAPEVFAAPRKGWVRAIRDALGMTGAQLGKRLGVTAPAVAALERSEANGTVQLNTLRRAAEAMDCVVVYALIPRTGLNAMVDARARDLARQALGRVSHSMTLEDQRSDRDPDVRIDAYISASIRDRDLWAAP